MAILLSAYSLFSVEFFFGLELLRPVFLWIGLRNREDNIINKARIKLTGLHWMPYFFVTILFLIWRIFIFRFPTKYQPVLFNDIISNPLLTIFNQVQIIIQDALKVNLFVWDQTLSLLKDNEGLSARLALGLAVIGGITAYFYLSKIQTAKDIDIQEDSLPALRWAWEAIGIGIFSTLVSGWPFWFVNAPISTDIGGDRYTVAFMMGACILLVGLLELLIRTHKQKILIISILVGLAIGQHFQDANSFRLVHKAQGAFFRQLAWRAPGLKPGTVLLTDKFPFGYTSDTSLTAPLNWIYNQDPPYAMQYAFFELDSRLGNTIPELKPGIPISYGYWSTDLHSTTSQVLVFNYSPTSCLHVIDPSIEQSSILPELVANAASLSNLHQIIVDADPPLEIIDELFGKESELDWCYYYEQADLARQKKDWDKVTQIGDKVFELGLSSESPIEYLPFIEGYAYSDQLNRAYKLTKDAFRSMPAIRPELCATWRRILNSPMFDNEKQTLITNFTYQLECSKLISPSP